MAPPFADPAEHRRTAARAGGTMMLAGSALAALTATLPPHAEGSEAVVWLLAALSAVFGAVLLSRRIEPSETVLGIAVATGTVLITIATIEGGGGDGMAGTADNEMLYVWICLLSFNFLTLPHALGQLALVGAAYAWMLTGEAFDVALTRWIVTLSTLGIAGLLVARLRSSRDELVSELSDRVRHDQLTGLLNRSALEERATLELARAARDWRPLSMLLLDIDAFKALNDTHGHVAGDRALQSVAARLLAETRQVDAVARFGGDEFGVLLPGADAADAALVAKRLVAHETAQGEPQLTLSVGVAEAAPDAHFEDLWSAADSAMYQAKRAGGDRVMGAGQEPLRAVSVA